MAYIPFSTSLRFDDSMCVRADDMDALTALFCEKFPEMGLILESDCIVLDTQAQLYWYDNVRPYAHAYPGSPQYHRAFLYEHGYLTPAEEFAEDVDAI